jgi:nitrogen regulatory protein PII
VKKIEAVVKPFKSESVREALTEIGVDKVFITRVEEAVRIRTDERGPGAV